MSCLFCGSSLLSFELINAKAAGFCCCSPNDFGGSCARPDGDCRFCRCWVLLLLFWLNLMLLFPLSSFLLTLLLLQLFLLLF